MSVNVVIPMAGLGSRFAKQGYKKPKPFIDVLGKPMIAQVMENLKIPDAKYILIARKEHLEKEKQIVSQLKENYNVEFIEIDQLTEGAAMTVLFAHRLIDNDEPLLIANSDQIVDIKISDFIDDMFDRSLGGSILTFADDNPKWSFAKTNESGLVEMVREKEVISDQATVGIYLYRRGKDFVASCIDMIVRNERVNNEFYVCPVYNHFIESGGRAGVYEIPKAVMHGIGTPEDLKVYLEIKQGIN